MSHDTSISEKMAETRALTPVSSHKMQKEDNVDEQQLGLELPEILRSLTDVEKKQLERRLVKKLDARLMAPLIVMYILNYLDRYCIL